MPQVEEDDTLTLSQPFKNVPATEARPFSALQDVVSHETLKAITVRPYQFTHMTPVQSAVFDYLPKLSDPYNPSDESRPPRDLLVKAMTGTGKTAAFVVPAIEQRIKAVESHGRQAVKDAGMDTDSQLQTRAKRVFARQHAGALIISPTRELATQIANEATRLSTHHPGFEVQLFLGGAPKGAQLRDWMRGRRDLVVATPGRLRDVLMSEPEVAKGLARTPMVSRFMS
jgi:ATP-dependent RNA helicase MSS116